MRCQRLSFAAAVTLPSELAGLGNIRLGERLNDQAESRDYSLMIIEGDRQAGGFAGEYVVGKSELNGQIGEGQPADHISREEESQHCRQNQVKQIVGGVPGCEADDNQ